MRQATRRSSSSELKITPYTVFGVLFVVLGTIALGRPNFTLPGKRSEVMVQNQKVLIETSRVISIPRVASAIEVALGIGLVFFGSRKPRQR
jgi:hypothetical protein